MPWRWSRRELWDHEAFRSSLGAGEIVKVPRTLVERLLDTLCYAA
jgi:hypothetical protein